MAWNVEKNLTLRQKYLKGSAGFWAPVLPGGCSNSVPLSIYIVFVSATTIDRSV
jgi:hypothetical protein